MSNSTMSKLETRHSYFSVELISLNDFEEKEQSEKDDLLEMMDFLFVGMNVKDDWYSFLSTDGRHYVYFLKCETRKRLGQLRRLCEKHLPSGEEFAIAGYDKVTFYTKLKQFQNSPEWVPIKQMTHYQEFTEEELELTQFDNRDNWFPWQREIYDKIFNEKKNIKRADNRKIVSIIDDEGKKGKSTFLKWICHSNPKDFLKLGQGSASQLRAAVLNNGPKRCYFIDLPRTQGFYDKKTDLLSVVEEIKNGHVMSSMYGKGGVLMMPPPHIFIFSNEALNYQCLSKDRWEVYTLTEEPQPRLKETLKNGVLLKKD
jgi:hypothetical protein